MSINKKVLAFINDKTGILLGFLFFVLKSLLRILVGFLKHAKAVKYHIVCYNNCKDDSYVY